MFIALASFAVCLGAAWLLTRALIPLLQRLGRIDRPNERSSHVIPVPRGGGLAIVVVLVVPLAVNAWLLADRQLVQPALLITAFLGLAVVSWYDDRKSMPVAVRLGAQFVAVMIGLAAIPAPALIFQGWLPPMTDHAVAALAWIWFINLYNFMDGIDGITGIESAMIGIGLALVVAVAGLDLPLAWLGAALAGAACGFLIWNWTPARLFLGDVGSVPLGFLIGFALLVLAAKGYAIPALILPLYYLFDATTTLLRRLLRGEKVWRAHRSHAYQIAAAASSHSAVVLQILALDSVLIVLALLAVWWNPTPAVTGACLLAALVATTLLTVSFRSSGLKAGQS
jgi:UDP-N-acetylmuramyl pentapeptide phosphotransferase/UDP-N-acetylglucosamine-1-phosphate transferase